MSPARKRRPMTPMELLETRLAVLVTDQGIAAVVRALANIADARAQTAIGEQNTRFRRGEARAASIWMATSFLLDQTATALALLPKNTRILPDAKVKHMMKRTEPGREKRRRA